LPVTKVSFQRNIGAVISQQLWAKLDKIGRAALTRYGNDPTKKSIGIADFFSGYKKGSKNIRNILCGKTTQTSHITWLNFPITRKLLLVSSN
jgi:hypothetical protein